MLGVLLSYGEIFVRNVKSFVNKNPEEHCSLNSVLRGD